MHSQLFLFAWRDDGESTALHSLLFRCKGAVSGFRVHRRSDRDLGGVLDVCWHKEKALMRMGRAGIDTRGCTAGFRLSAFASKRHQQLSLQLTRNG